MDTQLRAKQRAGPRLDHEQRPSLPVAPRAPTSRLGAHAHAKNVKAAGVRAGPAGGRAVTPLAAIAQPYAAGALPLLTPEVEEPAAAPIRRVPQVSDMEDILRERDACGVGFIASLKNVKSHTVVKQALTALGCMEHRGACSADDDSGDGAGLMTQIPWKLLKQEMPQLNELTTGVGMVFMPNNDELEAQSKQILEAVCAKEGVKVLGWRKVPVDHSIVGRFAKVTEPRIWQVLIEGKPGQVGDELERELYLVRKMVEKAKNAQLPAEFASDFYLCTLSSRTITYKGMLRSAVVGTYFRDLENTDYETAFAIYHRRFSTNTTPKWPLAQPMRVLGHNGEINTLQGNLNWVVSREHELKNPVWEGREEELNPLCSAAQSDSASLDNVAELLVRTGVDPQDALMLLVPEAYRNHPDLMKEYPEVVDFYEFYEGLQEGWDGPALLVFSDGKRVGARLDRNGLRPARFWRTKDDMIYVASEVGVLGDVISNAENIVAKGRLGPGQMVCADLEKGTFMETGAISKMVAARHPYKQWLTQSLRRLSDLGESTFLNEPMYDAATMLRLQASIGMGAEDAQMVVESQAQSGIEPTYCMGDDIPLAVLSDKAHILYNYFKQRFAQVTNPPIDPLREGLVMSLEMRLGARGNLLAPNGTTYKQVRLTSIEGVFDELGHGLEAVSGASRSSAATTNGRSPRRAANSAGRGSSKWPGGALEPGPAAATAAAPAPPGEPPPPLLPPGARASCPWPWWPLASGAGAASGGGGEVVCCDRLLPGGCGGWGCGRALAGPGCAAAGAARDGSRQYGTVAASVAQPRMPPPSPPPAPPSAAPQPNEVDLRGPARRTTSKLPATGSGIVPPTGLPTTDSRPKAGGRAGSRPTAGQRAERPRPSPPPPEGEEDVLGPPPPQLPLHAAAAMATARCARTAWGIGMGGDGRPTDPAAPSPPPRGDSPSSCSSSTSYDTDAMAPPPPPPPSRGPSTTARRSEMEETEQLRRTARRGRVATMAAAWGCGSGRCGCCGARGEAGGACTSSSGAPAAARLEEATSDSLAAPRARALARTRTRPGDLVGAWSRRRWAVNPRAKVSVKLVAEAGIGVVASGVAKANADIIQVSGHDGGTGASPISSIKHAGGPMEMGLAETHQTLVRNELRERVVLRVDGGVRNGRDVLLGALLGADEYGFGTVAMIATGCIMARVCHTNNCPVGVASQREELRARFPGVAEDLVNYFHFVADEVRAGLADMGYKSLDEVIGRADLLAQRPVKLAKTDGLDLSFLTTFAGPSGASSSRRTQEVHSNGPQLDDIVLADAEVMDAITNEKVVHKAYNIINTDRSAMGRVAGVIAKHHGDNGFAGTVKLTLTGSGGQSFGCFCIKGLEVKLVGEANDYVGKGMNGGELAILPPPNSPFAPETASLVGNTCLYGATGGRLFVNGRAGERFAVRNSMAEAVVEGAGDHCCEYMTGGCVVVLGAVGRNVAAGMTGGLAYFLDEDESFCDKVNTEIVAVQRVVTKAGEAQLKGLLEAHVEKTGSAKTKGLLANWEATLPKFWQLVPPAEKNTPEVNPTVALPQAVRVAVKA
ncbi:Ferredoxin-dependent glutamate synthase, chloroplastic [Tetrabaena socialis]|uniref:glutamate synthase (ferredoxin) n=1 Tax=Tetrabaena socialis TaxID=47790 RepID=A0A2J7ZZT6_9CHLO|nr:Ferredoxin-dependent glutamate synthase, chloroplastic [Tetrabaena socialis]|eukprot:PNH05784.1 Ferredoxin-dependent glutamate synthase, chloroplastic [Tetrabaena socialis]